MGKVVSCLLLASLLGCHDSSATPDKDIPPTASSPTAHPKFEVVSFCLAGGSPSFSKPTGRKGNAFDVDMLVALTGTETITEASAPDSKKVRRVGDKNSVRLLMTISCKVFLPDEESIADALNDDRESEASDCRGTSYLDLAALEAGKPFSISLHPFDEVWWRIRAIAPGFGSIEIGEGEGENLRITGIRPFKDSKTLDMGGAHVSWNYSEGGARFGASRVELAADCPTMK